MIDDLRNNIDKARAAYYGKAPIVSDSVYDAWIRQLKKLDPTDHRLTAVGPQYSREDMRNKVTHAIVCGSLDNIEGGIDGYADWVNGVQPGMEVVLSHKMDGSSLVLSYLDGTLTRATTRGNGEVGEDVTANAVMFSGVKTVLPAKWTGDIRGEAILSKKNFEALMDGVPEDDITNPRNIGNGIVGRTDGTDADKMSFFAFSMVDKGEQFNPTQTIIAQYEQLTKWGLNVVEYRLCRTIEAAEAWYKEVIDGQDDLPFQIDGLVCVANCPEVRASLITSDVKSVYRPKYAKAIKPPVVSCGTTLTGVTRSVGHTGAIIPTGTLKPVKIGGVTVSNVLLNNWDEIERLGVAIGDEVEVGLAGCIIPKVFSVIQQGENRQTIAAPTHCPMCDERTTKAEDKAHYFCTNSKCPGIMLGKVHHWIGSSKKGIGILGLGDAMVEQLYANGLVRDPADLYTLTVEQLSKLSLESGSKSILVGVSRAKSILKSIDGKRKLPLHVFLGALGVELLGSRRAIQMIEKANGKLDTIEQWLDDDNMASIQMDGFGDVQRAAIRNGLKFNADLIQKLLRNGVEVMPNLRATITVTGKVNLSGISFCWTGCRDYIDEVKACGGIEKSGISKGLNYLVQKDALSRSNKSLKAIEYGTQIIGVDYLRKVLDGVATL